MTSSCACGDRIDTHHHIIPPAYLARARDRVIGDAPALAKSVLEWNPARAVEALDRAGIATAITSISSPGIWFGDRDTTRALSRECNDYAAGLKQNHPGRFGQFATLPLPDVDASLREIEYALDTLHAEGIGLVTNIGGQYPGDPAFKPIFDELNRQSATVYFHPTAAFGCANLLPGIQPATLEFPFDTTRAILSLLHSGTFSRCTNIRWIFSHGGGALATVAQRIVGMARFQPEMNERIPEGVFAAIAKLHFDVVNIAQRPVFDAVRSLVDISHLLFGTDYPYMPIDLADTNLGKLALAAAEVRAIERDNALRLFPHLDGERTTTKV
jgi:6-methylsalicylate decarboxylase